MSSRLVDLYPVGTSVDVLFRGTDAEAWIPARVQAHAHPGIWVAAPDGSRWFVTNGGRIRPGDSAQLRDAVIYKIASDAEWEETERTGTFPGAPADLRDGFVHFSTAAQVRETAAKHFAGRTDLVLLDVDSRRLAPGTLRWEVSRGGQEFPHLYAALPRGAVVRVRPLPLGADGAHVF